MSSTMKLLFKPKSVTVAVRSFHAAQPLATNYHPIAMVSTDIIHNIALILLIAQLADTVEEDKSIASDQLNCFNSLINLSNQCKPF